MTIEEFVQIKIQDKLYYYDIGINRLLEVTVIGKTAKMVIVNYRHVKNRRITYKNLYLHKMVESE